MSDYDNAIFRLATAQEAEPEDYTGEDGLLYCGSCRQPKEAYFPEGKTFFGHDRYPKECDCQRKRREKREAADREQKHRELWIDFVGECRHGQKLFCRVYRQRPYGA